jgi:hypothetical protein
VRVRSSRCQIGYLKIRGIYLATSRLLATASTPLILTALPSLVPVLFMRAFAVASLSRMIYGY